MCIGICMSVYMYVGLRGECVSMHVCMYACVGWECMYVSLVHLSYNIYISHIFVYIYIYTNIFKV